MTSAGLDMGALWTKAVVLEDAEVIGYHVAPTGGDTRQAAEDALAEVKKPAGISMDDLTAVVATGAGKEEVGFASGQATDVLCAAKGINFLHPEARGVIDLGGESTRALRLTEAGDVAEFALNDKCAAGTGVFLDAMAKVMGVEVDQMGPISLQATGDVAITSMCVVFAESEVVSQVHRQTPRQDIIKGIHRSIATRVFGMVRRIELGQGCMAIGGLARNVGIITCLEELMGEKLMVPEHPQIVSALGAALIAAGKGDRA